MGSNKPRVIRRAIRRNEYAANCLYEVNDSLYATDKRAKDDAERDDAILCIAATKDSVDNAKNTYIFEIQLHKKLFG